MQGYRAISSLLASWTGTFGEFIRELDRRGVSYVSYSQVSALEFCRYRYFLQYVKRLQLRPQPDYFVKGHIFHEAAAKYYRGLARGRHVTIDLLHSSIDRHGRNDGHHLKNALTLAIQNAHSGWEVIGVEEPFVLSIGRRLPPCVGVIDLVLRKGNHYAVVDHKTGRKFNDPDELQVKLYHEYVRRRYQAEMCLAFFDEYRWVNNLNRLRKPAFQRTEVRVTAQGWKNAEARLVDRYAEMREIHRKNDAPDTGPCRMCPFFARCPKASLNPYDD